MLERHSRKRGPNISRRRGPSLSHNRAKSNSHNHGERCSRRCVRSNLGQRRCTGMRAENEHRIASQRVPQNAGRNSESAKIVD